MMAITKDMSIGQVVSDHPETIPVFKIHGMGCFGWGAARFENIEQGAQAHGIDVEILMRDLNDSIKKA